MQGLIGPLKELAEFEALGSINCKRIFVDILCVFAVYLLFFSYLKSCGETGIRTPDTL